jgi:hypothetical protein
MNEGNSKVMSVLPYNKVRREALYHTIGNLSPITSGDALWDRWGGERCEGDVRKNGGKRGAFVSK